MSGSFGSDTCLTTSKMDKFLATDPDVVQQLCDLGIYDYIVVGSGIGGGILCEELASRGKKVLLIERGSSTFSTHVCNTARPDFSRGRNDSPEGNETIYNAIKSWVQTAEDSEPYVGGPMYCLGGRSIVWGLWIPRTDKETLDKHFPRTVGDELHNKWFDEAFNLVTNDSQKENVYPVGTINAEELDAAKAELSLSIKEYIALGSKVDVGPIATQFNSPGPYRFSQGAYSTVVPILNRIYARDRCLSVLMDAEVLDLDIPKPSDPSPEKLVTSLTVRVGSTQNLHKLSTGQAKVILCAGTIGTAKIALNSGLNLHQGLNKVGKGLIDHAVWGVRFARRRDPASKLKDPVNLQCLINICNTTALLTVTVNANFFLAGSTTLPIKQYLKPNGEEMRRAQGRLDFDPHNYDTIAILIEFGAPLDDKNEVLDVPSAAPTIRVRRQMIYSDESDQIEMQNLATKIRDGVITQILPLPDIQHLSSASPNVVHGGDTQLPPLPVPAPLPPTPKVNAPRLALLGCGIFAHEVGTMRMNDQTGTGGVVDDNLQVKGFNNLYACDLSVLPYSPPANPTLTLAGLSMRLANHFAPAPEVKTNA